MRLVRLFSGLAAAVLLLGALPAAAQPAAAGQTAAAPAPITGQEAADAVVVRAAMVAVTQGGFRALRDHLPALNEVCKHTPASYPRVVREPGRILVRTDEGEALEPDVLMALVGAAVEGRALQVNYGLNVYGMAYLMRGSYAVEMSSPDLAIQVLDEGLARQPDNVNLMAEKGSALGLLRRFEEARVNYNRGLAVEIDFVSDAQRGRLLRGRGYALIELGRLDEAEADFNAVLRLDPGNALARNELTYIAQLRRAGRSSPPPGSPPPAAQAPGSTPKTATPRPLT